MMMATEDDNKEDCSRQPVAGTNALIRARGVIMKKLEVITGAVVLVPLCLFFLF